MMTWLWGVGQPGDRDVFMDGYHRYAMWDAAYVLGSLSAGDRREFETHMADCPACRQAVVEISGIPAMLSQFDGNDIAAVNGSGHVSEVSAMSWQSLPSLQAMVRCRRRRTRLMSWTISAAAAVVVTIAVAVGIQGRFLTPPPPLAPLECPRGLEVRFNQTHLFSMIFGPTIQFDDFSTGFVST